MFNLALCYSQGFIGVSDPTKAKLLFKRAADLGDHYSKLFYVDLLLNGDTSLCS
jgi:TPR repeat protein